MIKKVEEMPNLPDKLYIRDWKKVTIDYNDFVFDLNLKGDFLPLVWIEESGFNTKKKTFGLPSYISSTKSIKHGSQESINCVTAILSATLCGIDKSNDKNVDWVEMIENYYNTENGEFLFLDRENTKSGNTFWYEIFPHILLGSIVYLYPNYPKLKEIMYRTSKKWLKAVEVLGRNEADFNYTAFNFKKMSPVNNGKWIEPDSSAGLATILYFAYKQFNDTEFFEGVKWCLDFLEKSENNPNYELLMPYGAYIMARMNMEHESEYNLEKALNWCFDNTSACRPGWGVLTGKWNGTPIDGLCGSNTDYGQRWDELESNADYDFDKKKSGYAFAGNTFSMAGPIVPIAKYDTRFAKDIAKWALNMMSNSRFFYSNSLSKRNQSCAFWNWDDNNVIAYEGLRKYWDGVSPYATGDAIRYSWGRIDLGLYGSSFVGFLGGICKKTNVEGVIALDCNKTDFYSDENYPTYLLYNPYKKEVNINMTENETDYLMYDSISKSIINKDNNSSKAVLLKADYVAMIVKIPIDSKFSLKKNKLYANDKIIDFSYNNDKIQIY